MTVKILHAGTGTSWNAMMAFRLMNPQATMDKNDYPKRIAYTPGCEHRFISVQTKEDVEPFAGLTFDTLIIHSGIPDAEAVDLLRALVNKPA